MSNRTQARGVATVVKTARDAVTALLVSSLALPGFAAPASAQHAIAISAPKRTASVHVAVGKSEDVRTDAGFVDITVGDPEIADVHPLTDHSLSVLGKKIGTTRVSVYGEDKRLVGIFDVEVSYDVSRLAEEVAHRFPGSKLRVSSVNGRILLSGSAADATQLDAALALAKQFGPEVINSVVVAAPQQVMMEVRFIEVSRSASRELGVQWNVFNRNGVVHTGSRQPASALPISAPTSPTNIPAGEIAAGVISGASPFGFALGRIINSGSSIDVLINALEEKGIARTLAEPNLTAMSGETASFLAGGEYPIPVSQQFGTISVDYKRYGVGLAFTPTVLSGGQINIKIEPEVSEIDTTRSVSVGPNITVPALTVRRASTTIELRDGQSFMIGGLLQSNGRNDIEQLPWIGEVPVLGALFRSASYQKRETDLAIIVTPRLARPMRPGDPIRTPVDNSVAANDADLFLAGKVEVPRSELRPGIPERPYVGHILSLPKGVAHVSMR
ncbi:MAG TPA: type II and III secretion system protein family protein [Xanthobacteraceae bacterium]|nr:type II and III secretion system protein family protein [Xanthobacteraceae bacterium]